MASTAGVPSTRAARAAALLLVIRTACCRRADRPPDDACDGDEREDVREGLEERPPRIPVRRRERGGDRAQGAEEQGREPGQERPPLAEAECREPDEPDALGHVLVE